MSQIAICPASAQCRARYLGSQHLPEKYMEDFTLMGFVVDNYQDAVTVIKNAGFVVSERDGGSAIEVAGPGHLTEIQSLLTCHRIHSVFADIADTLYQA